MDSQDVAERAADLTAPRRFHTVAAPTRPMVVFVLGMGRSGTSALTRVLSLCGGALPTVLLGPNEGNPLGHWEPQEALELNDTFLSRHGANWYDPTLRLQGELAVTSEERSAYLDQIEAFLESLPAAPLLIIKEPRITALSEFWFEAVRRLGYAVGIVIPVRHPQEVAASLAARERVSAELSSVLWLKYNLLAERRSRGLPRVFVEYATLLRDWRTEVSRISAALSVDLSARDDAAIDGFLRPDLRRQRNCGQIADIFGTAWVAQVYDTLSSAARGETPDTRLLDSVFGSFQACERAFRLALSDFHARLPSAASLA